MSGETGPRVELPATADIGEFVRASNKRFAPLDIGDLRREAAREVEMRERNYPKWISAGRLDRAQASRQQAAMRHIVALLFTLENTR